MLNNKTIAVVVPAYNEEMQILQVLESMPDFVDRIVVVNDCSKDNTALRVLECIKTQKPVVSEGSAINPIIIVAGLVILAMVLYLILR